MTPNSSALSARELGRSTVLIHLSSVSKNLTVPAKDNLLSLYIL